MSTSIPATALSVSPQVFFGKLEAGMDVLTSETFAQRRGCLLLCGI
ncbi:MAG: hypothetical protein LBJ07_05040 [Actinomycetes bacterium]|nr:hypothetical protein [Actinomycetes bacterium]